MAYQLGDSTSDVQRSFHNTLDVMYTRLGFFVCDQRGKILMSKRQISPG